MVTSIQEHFQSRLLLIVLKGDGFLKEQLNLQHIYALECKLEAPSVGVYSLYLPPSAIELFFTSTLLFLQA